MPDGGNHDQAGVGSEWSVSSHRTRIMIMKKMKGSGSRSGVRKGADEMGMQGMPFAPRPTKPPRPRRVQRIKKMTKRGA
jgi:hypothetical protein